MSASYHRPTLRVLEILEVVSEGGKHGYTLAEIAAALGAPKSSLFPVVHTMKEYGYLRYGPASSRYLLGSKAYETGMKYTSIIDEHNRILAILQSIVKACSESCHYGELSGGDALFLMKADSPEQIRMFSAPGKKAPAYSTALGKALLSQMTEEELRCIYPNGLKPLTKHTITDMDELLRQLKIVRETGIATECEENYEMIRCFAVPIKRNGIVAAAISVAVPIFRCTEEKTEAIISLLVLERPRIEAILFEDQP